MKKLFPFLISFLLIALPGVAFAVEESCSEDTVCECTDAEGTAISIPDDSISDGAACSDECAGRDSVSYALKCGDDATPIDSGDVPSGDAEATTEEAETPSIPALNVPIPGLDLSGSVQVDESGNIETNMIGLYVNAVFSYGITLAAIFGVLMFTIAGFQYMTAGGDKGAVSKAKARMTNTLFGIVILMATYSIAFLIDPRTTYFNSLTIETIDRIAYVNQSGLAEGSLIFDPPGDILCSPDYSISEIVHSMENKVTYRLGGVGQAPPYALESETYVNSCPEGQICLDCAGFVDYVLSCAELETSRLAIRAAFSPSEPITSCTSTKVNGKNLVPGDILSITANNGVTQWPHVWIYIDNGQTAESWGLGREGNALHIDGVKSVCDFWMKRSVQMYVLRITET
ncbi:MAG: pilin [Patescibacteria group bacterium]